MKINKITYIFLVSFLILINTFQLKAQETLIVGQVLNASDSGPVADVNVFFKNTVIGVKTNDEGYFLIRTQGNETTLVFSCVGYRRKEIRIKQGKSVGIQVVLQEQSTLLQDVFVVPGSNPAMDLMKKVRERKQENDVYKKSSFSARQREQVLVLLAKLNQRSIGKRIYEQLSKGALTYKDTTLTIPIYMTEIEHNSASKSEIIKSKDVFSSTPFIESILQKLIGKINFDQNFYDNSVKLFDKNFVSPLSNVGNIYYNYYLADSTLTEGRKIYQVHFLSKNPKNLVFNGNMQIDSSTYALVSINADLPNNANLNFVNNLRIRQSYKYGPDHVWSPDNSNTTLDLMYELLADSIHPKPRIFLHRNTVTLNDGFITSNKTDFAQSNYSTDTLHSKLDSLNDTPLVKTAKWLADIIITGYIPIGKIDVGKIQQLARITDIEGFRLNIPVYTNERWSRNFRFGGYLGYGFKNNIVKYSGLAEMKLSGNKFRALSASYTNDYRSENYNYNDFLIRENPLNSGDEDISGTIFGLRSAGNMSERHEWNFSASNDWNSDIESKLIFRQNIYYPGPILPFRLNGVDISSIKQESVTFFTRFSSGESVYDDHFQRIYNYNNKPVIYAIFEGGRYQNGVKSGNYAKISGMLKQEISFSLGMWGYMVEVGTLLGEMPYTLLKMPSGNVTNGYGKYNFALMNQMEYRADRYILMHNEISLNGILFNQIPVIKYLNLRELMSLKMFYGTMRDAHKNVLDIPEYIHTTKVPYIEVGVGFSNLLRILTLQSFWRLTENDRPGTTKWGIKASIRISL